MCNYQQKFSFKRELWAKYSIIGYGFDMYRAEFVSSIPKKPIKVNFGKWFVDIRFMRWQILLNKMTKEQIERMKLSAAWDEQSNQTGFNNHNNLSF